MAKETDLLEATGLIAFRHRTISIRKVNGRRLRKADEAAIYLIDQRLAELGVEPDGDYN